MVSEEWHVVHFNFPAPYISPAQVEKDQALCEENDKCHSEFTSRNIILLSYNAKKKKVNQHFKNILKGELQ